MESSYDVVICGTGPAEILLALLLSQEGKKILQVDKNPHPGNEYNNMDLKSFWKAFRLEGETPKTLTPSSEWNINMAPKAILSGGTISKILSITKLSEYIQCDPIDVALISHKSNKGMELRQIVVPAEAMMVDFLKTPTMGLFEKRRFKQFTEYCEKYQASDPTTHKGWNLAQITFEELANKFNLSNDSVNLIGEGYCLFDDNGDVSHTKRPAIEVAQKTKVYVESANRFGKSSFMIPCHGLESLYQGFCKLAGAHGNSIRMNQNVEEFILDDTGKVCAVKIGEESIPCKSVISHPSYLLDSKLKNKVKCDKKVIRCVCILNHPLAGYEKQESLHIVIPRSQVKRKSDIYMLVLSNKNGVCPEGNYIAVISTIAETDDQFEKEILPALELLGKIEEKIMALFDLYEPDIQLKNEESGDLSKQNFAKSSTTTRGDENFDNIFVTRSLDQLNYDRSLKDDIMRIYRAITGKERISRH